MKHEKQKDISDLYSNLIDCEPKSIRDFVPLNGQEQKDLFLSDIVRNPDHIYDKLDGKDFDGDMNKIIAIGEKIITCNDLNPKFASVYQEYITRSTRQTQMMKWANAYNHSTTPEEREVARKNYMDLDIELYGEPSEPIYRSLLQERLDEINQQSYLGQASVIRDELFLMVNYRPSAEISDRYIPPQSTVDWMHEIAQMLYGGILGHLPEKEQFATDEVRDIFTEIIEKEFGDSAKGWTVSIEKAQAVNVDSTGKHIIIPDSKKSISYDSLKKLIVHEIGVHMLRSIMGEQSDLPLLANGLSGYGDSEEGLAVVMEQAIDGKFSERGIEHYITAGLVYFDQKDFRDAFEIKWRIMALRLAQKNGTLVLEDINKSKNIAYNAVMRCMRGTDELPWFKDLSYYNGAIDMWRHLEDIEGNDLMFQFVFMGKANPANPDHNRAMYETKTE